jgi:ASC-1-like (ASCH) protein
VFLPLLAPATRNICPSAGDASAGRQHWQPQRADMAVADKKNRNGHPISTPAIEVIVYQTFKTKVMEMSLKTFEAGHPNILKTLEMKCFVDVATTFGEHRPNIE